MASVKEVLKQLAAKSRPDQLAGMARYGMAVDKRLGVAVPEMRKIASEIGQDHHLALKLWRSGIAEAMIVASMVDIPEVVTAAQMEEWVRDFNSWDVCDQVCMNLFEKTPLAWNKIQEWTKRDEEFVKRAAFALIACLAWHDKETSDERFKAREVDRHRRRARSHRRYSAKKVEEEDQVHCHRQGREQTSIEQ